MATKTKNTQPTTTISQAESHYGNAEPQIALRFPRGTHHRVLKAALHKLAADVELAERAPAAPGHVQRDQRPAPQRDRDHRRRHDALCHEHGKQ